MSLSSKAVSGVKWLMLSQSGRQGLQLITTAILAHLLNPADFGLIGMAGVVIGFVSLFKDLGTSAAVIHRKDITEIFLSSIYWVNAFFGLGAMVILFLLAPVVAYFYNEPRVEPLLQLLSATFIVSGLSIVQQGLLEREMSFKKLALVELVAIVFGSAIGISAAICGNGVWSLVYQSLGTVTASTVLLWSASHWKPKMIFQWSEVMSVRNYSLNLTGSSIFNYISRNADHVLIGKYLGAQDLGYYALAYRLMLYPLQNISSVIGRVMFPLYSQIQNDNAQFREVYLRVSGAIALITFPMMLGFWVIAEPFVLLFFGPQWKPVVQLLVILVPVGMAQSIVTTVGVIYQAKGRTDVMFRWGAFTGFLVMLAFAIGLRWGIVGVAAAYAGLSALLSYPSLAIPLKLIDLPMRDLGKALRLPLYCSLLMLVVLMAINSLLPAHIPFGLVLSILITCGIIVYLTASWVANREQMMKVVDLIRVKM